MQFIEGKSSPRVWFNSDLRAIRNFAEAMAEEMEKRISANSPLNASLVESAFLATPGHQRHSGHSYARVISYLTEHWKYGQTLRQIHNSSEGGAAAASFPGVLDISQLNLSVKRSD